MLLLIDHTQMQGLAIRFIVENNLSNKAGDQLLSLFHTVQDMSGVAFPCDFRKMVARVSNDWGRKIPVNTCTIDIAGLHPALSDVSAVTYR